MQWTIRTTGVRQCSSRRLPVLCNREALLNNLLRFIQRLLAAQGLIDLDRLNDPHLIQHQPLVAGAQQRECLGVSLFQSRQQGAAQRLDLVADFQRALDHEGEAVQR